MPEAKKKIVSRKRVLAAAVATLMGSTVMSVAAISPAYADWQGTQGLYTAGSATTYDLMTNLFGGTPEFGNPVPSPGNTPSVTNIYPGTQSGGIPISADCQQLPGAPTGDTNAIDFGTNTESWATWPATDTAGSPASGWTAPNGSGQGRNSLLAEDLLATQALGDYSCIDIARSSSYSANAAFQYYAYALDAVSYIVGSAATANLPAGTPAQLTLQQIYNIFYCNSGYTNWNTVQVGVTPSGTPIYGANAPIYRWWVQSGSGTLAVAQNTLSTLTQAGPNIGLTQTTFDPTVAGNYSQTNCANSILNYSGSFVNEENEESWTSASTTTPASLAGAIMPFSVGRFIYQWDNPGTYASGFGNWNTSLTIADVAGLGTLATGDVEPYQYGQLAAGNKAYPFPTTIAWGYSAAPNGNPFVTGGKNANGVLNGAVVNEASEFYHNYGTTTYLVPGVRYLYNVVDTNNFDYAAAMGQVGFNNTALAEGPTGSITIGSNTYPAPAQVAVGAKSNLCADAKIGPSSPGLPATIILANGFLPLNNAISSHNTTGSFCRQW